MKPYFIHTCTMDGFTNILVLLICGLISRSFNWPSLKERNGNRKRYNLRSLLFCFIKFESEQQTLKQQKIREQKSARRGPRPSLVFEKEAH